jgi:hypothetical protein
LLLIADFVTQVTSALNQPVNFRSNVLSHTLQNMRVQEYGEWRRLF